MKNVWWDPETESSVFSDTGGGGVGAVSHKRMSTVVLNGCLVPCWRSDDTDARKNDAACSGCGDTRVKLWQGPVVDGCVSALCFYCIQVRRGGVHFSVSPVVENALVRGMSDDGVYTPPVGFPVSPSPMGLRAKYNLLGAAPYIMREGLEYDLRKTYPSIPPTGSIINSHSCHQMSVLQSLLR